MTEKKSIFLSKEKNKIKHKGKNTNLKWFREK